MTRYRRGKLQSRLVVGLDRLPGAGDLRFDDDGVVIGAAVTLGRLERDTEFRLRWPVIADVIGTIASPAIRSMGTAVGNVAQGWNVGDLVPLLQVCDAQLDIVGLSGTRRMSVVEYAKRRGVGSLQPGELITTLRVPSPPQGFRIAYERFSFKEAFELPLVAAAVAANRDGAALRDVRVALVGAAAMPSRFERVESSFEGAVLDQRNIDAGVAMAMLTISPPNDHRASADYRRHVMAVTLKRALTKLI